MKKKMFVVTVGTQTDDDLDAVDLYTSFASIRPHDTDVMTTREHCTRHDVITTREHDRHHDVMTFKDRGMRLIPSYPSSLSAQDLLVPMDHTPDFIWENCGLTNDFKSSMNFTSLHSPASSLPWMNNWEESQQLTISEQQLRLQHQQQQHQQQQQQQHNQQQQRQQQQQQQRQPHRSTHNHFSNNMGVEDYIECLTDEQGQQLCLHEVILRRERDTDLIGLTLWNNKLINDSSDEDAVEEDDDCDDLIDEENIFVGEIDPEGIAGRDGRIQPGDQIIQINGVKILSRDQAIEAIQSNHRLDISLLLLRHNMKQKSMEEEEDEDDDDSFTDEGLGVSRMFGGGFQTFSRGGRPTALTVAALQYHHHTPLQRHLAMTLECIDEEEYDTDTGMTEETGSQKHEDSGVGKTDDSTRNEESSEQELADNDCTSPRTGSKSNYARCEVGGRYCEEEEGGFRGEEGGQDDAMEGDPYSDRQLQRSNESFCTTDGHESDAGGDVPSPRQSLRFYDMLKDRCNANVTPQRHSSVASSHRGDDVLTVSRHDMMPGQCHGDVTSCHRGSNIVTVGRHENVNSFQCHSDSRHDDETGDLSNRLYYNVKLKNGYPGDFDLINGVSLHPISSSHSSSARLSSSRTTETVSITSELINGNDNSYRAADLINRVSSTSSGSSYSNHSRSTIHRMDKVAVKSCFPHIARMVPRMGTRVEHCRPAGVAKTRSAPEDITQLCIADGAVLDAHSSPCEETRSLLISDGLQSPQSYWDNLIVPLTVQVQPDVTAMDRTDASEPVSHAPASVRRTKGIHDLFAGIEMPQEESLSQNTQKLLRRQKNSDHRVDGLSQHINDLKSPGNVVPVSCENARLLDNIQHRDVARYHDVTQNHTLVTQNQDEPHRQDLAPSTEILRPRNMEIGTLRDSTKRRSVSQMSQTDDEDKRPIESLAMTTRANNPSHSTTPMIQRPTESLSLVCTTSNNPAVQSVSTIIRPSTVDVMYTNQANLQHTINVQQRLYTRALAGDQFKLFARPQYIAARQSNAVQNLHRRDVGNNIWGTAKRDPHLIGGMLPTQCILENGNNSPPKEMTVVDDLEWVVKRRADGTRYITRRPVRNRLRKERAKRVEEERRCLTTDDDAASELKVGRYWNREERKRHVEKARIKRREKEAASLQRCMRVESGFHVATENSAVSHARNNIAELSRIKMMRHRGRRTLDSFTTVPEILANGTRDVHHHRTNNNNSNNNNNNPLLSVTTV